MITTFKDDHVIPSQPTNDFHVSKNEDPDSNYPFTELVKSQKESNLLATPSTSTSDQKLKASNSRSRKRDSFGNNKGFDSVSPSVSRFTVGKSEPKTAATVKRKLHMEDNTGSSKSDECKLTPKKVVTFQKAGSLSPCKVIKFPFDDTFPCGVKQASPSKSKVS